MPVPVISNVANAIAVHKEKGLSFIQEFCFAAGAGLGLTMGFDRAANPPIAQYTDPLFSFAASGPGTGMLMYGAIALGGPVLANVIDGTTTREAMSLEHCLATHSHEASQRAGLVAGVLFTAAVIYTTVATPNYNHKLDFAPILQVGGHVMASLGEATERAFPRLDLVFSQ